MTRDRSAGEELHRRGINGVPTFIIGEEVIVGFDPQKVEAAIDFRIVSCPECKKKLRVPRGKKLRITCSECQTVFEE